MREPINRKDKHGTILCEGDIVAECTLGESIWEDQGTIIKRPLGVVILYPKPINTALIPPEETDFYNISGLRCGLVKLNDTAKEHLKHSVNNAGYMPLYVSTYDGKFYAWDNIEKIGSIYDLDNEVE